MNMISRGQVQRLAERNIQRPVISHIRSWQSKTALLIALGMTSTAALPILTAPAARAEASPTEELLAQSSQVIVPAGTTIPVRYDEAERIIVTPNETAPVTLTVAHNVRSASRKILIPVDSQVKGELKPASGGSQFVAKELILSDSGQRLPINAVSEIIAANQTLTEKTKPKVLEGAALGAGAGAILGGIFGGAAGLGLGLLSGAGAGALTGDLKGGGQKQVKLVEIDPDTDLHLFVRADLVRSR